MVEGDEWKNKGQTDEWNSPKRIFCEELLSIVREFANISLSPFTKRGKSFDKALLELVKSDLELKIKHPGFKNLPFPIKRGYESFENLIEVLGKVTNEEIEGCKVLLDKFDNLTCTCSVYAHTGKFDNDFYLGRNPCRGAQYKMYMQLNKAEKEQGGSQLLEAIRRMFDVCKKCPYK